MASGNAHNTHWFQNWFNTPYYHILYKNRDDQEAHKFIDNLTELFKINTTHSVLDVGCGKGRFAKYLSLVGCQVVGLDISSENIDLASQYSADNLKFVQGDMRAMEFDSKFDFVLNMFTSFGYFENEIENSQAINSMASALKPGGYLILDFFNTPKVLSFLPVSDHKIVDGIDFNIRKFREDNYIVKDITFTHNGEEFQFQERVQALDIPDFRMYFKMAGLHDIHIWGDYDFNPWNIESERIIFSARKEK